MLQKDEPFRASITSVKAAIQVARGSVPSRNLSHRSQAGKCARLPGPVFKLADFGLCLSHGEGGEQFRPVVKHRWDPSLHGPGADVPVGQQEVRFDFFLYFRFDI